MGDVAARTPQVVDERTESGAGHTRVGAEPAASGQGTRERILDIALDLFIEKGFDKTSLREIAERLGFSKAALYYHFASKDDILLALHYRLHDSLKGVLGSLQRDPSVASWAALLDGLIDQMLANRRLFVLHERNRAAFEQLHAAGHEVEHEDFEEDFRRMLADESVPLRDRVRMACSFGAVMGGLFLGGDLFGRAPSDQLGQLLRDAVGDLLSGAAQA
jgi:AcrR family transcriptional regulator